MPQYHYNSTIKIAQGFCDMCGRGKGKQPLKSKKPALCQYHYDINSKLKSLNKAAEREEDEIVETFGDLVKDADTIFSQYIRLSNADHLGVCHCYTCSYSGKWITLQNGHYISRSHLYLRWNELNCKPQCENCNIHLRGNLIVFANRLDEERLGATELLYEQSHLAYKFTREELRDIISSYTEKVRILKSKLPSPPTT